MSQSSTHALALRIDRAAPTRLPVQLAEQIRARVRSGELVTGARLPSSRSVAGALGVSRAVSGAAYDQLVAEGWLETRRGAGTYVRRVVVPDTTTPAGATGSDRESGPTIDLRPGQPWTPQRPTDAWRRAWREVAHAPPPAGYPDPRGTPELREAIADHVARSRGLPCGREQVMVTSGTTHGMGLVLQELWRDGGGVAVEDPGYRAAAATAVAAGWSVWDVQVDGEGLCSQALYDAPVNVCAAYTTASHQYPMGVLMPIQRRLDLLAWARERDGFVIEDDYDSEFRYDVAPLPTLADLDPERVVYLGTVSKTLGAGVRMGWIVARPELIDALARARDARHDHPPWPIQRAMLSLLRDGEWDRAVRAARRRYAYRDRLIEQRLGGFGTLSGVGAGIHTTLLLEPDVAASVAADVARHGVAVSTLAENVRSRRDLGGIVVGYGTVTDDQLSSAIDIVVTCLARRLGR